MADAALRTELEHLLVDRGAALVACADLGPLPAELRHALPQGVSIGVALSPPVVAGIAEGPTKQYAAEYERVNELLDRLGGDCAAFLREHGFRAVAGEATVAELDQETLATPLPHKTVARLAGVGWIGKCALLVTEQYGSAVRHNTVLSDAPLPVGAPMEASRCGDCAACVDACPAGAPSGRHWQPTMQRADFFDAFACCECAGRQAEKAGIDQTICGICIAACPHTKRYLAREDRHQKKTG